MDIYQKLFSMKRRFIRPIFLKIALVKREILRPNVIDTRLIALSTRT
jgi:hypothetical protein